MKQTEQHTETESSVRYSVCAFFKNRNPKLCL